jgi:CMP-N,N'-diacetyllegionaminic acid synthase
VSEVLALIPARSGSKGIPNKNFRPLAGNAPVARAYDVAKMAGVRHVVISTDSSSFCEECPESLYAPAPLHTDTCPMIDVVTDALARVPGPPDQIIVLLQPTQPLREPKHVQAAIALLQETQADSVVSVVELPRTHSPHWQGLILDGQLVPFPTASRVIRTTDTEAVASKEWAFIAQRRQDLAPTYIRDGTVYCFYRQTVQRFGTIYGQHVRPLIIPASETQALDTPSDWAEAERRLRARQRVAVS